MVEVTLPSFAHKKSFLPGATERKEKEPHDGGHKIHTDRLVKRNSVSCGIRMTHHSAAPQLSVCYSIVCIGQRDRILLSRLMLITSKTVILPHFLHFDST